MRQSLGILLLLGFAAAAPAQMEIRTIDGSGNNPNDPDMGRADTPLLRMLTTDYGDGLSTPAGAGQPSARDVSNAVHAQTESRTNALLATDWVWQWGQFVDHDIDLTENASPAEPFDIEVPTCDPFFDPDCTGTMTIGLNRSIYEVDESGVRQQVNQITAWIDASNVYGSDDARALELRTLDGTGRLKTSAGKLLPFNVNGFPNAPAPTPEFFLAGDVRANEQNGLTAVHTLFVREHNTVCDALAAVFPSLSGEQRYQIARMIVGAEMQAITYREFLPVLLGPDAIPPYSGYDPNLDASIGNGFSTGTYRFGHSMLSPVLLRLGPAMNEIPAGSIELKDAFFNPGEIVARGIEPLLRGLAVQLAQDVDVFIVDDVRNFLFGPPGAGGFDLASLNVQRGRDHGLPRYNQARVDMGLAPKAGFAEVSSDPVVQARLASVYATVDDVDVWTGGLAEDHLPGALVGELVHAMLSDQFTRLRDGDRLWYENNLPASIVQFVKGQRLASIIRRNTLIGDELPDAVFRKRDAELTPVSGGSVPTAAP